MLSQGGPFDQVTGIKEIARELRCRMKHFTANLEEIRDKVEDTDRCYQLLDKVGGVFWRICNKNQQFAGLRLKKKLMSIIIFLNNFIFIFLVYFYNVPGLA